MELKNYDELIPEIARVMLDHDKAHTGHQEDIYLYVDENGNGRLHLFTNVGGNSWLDDDHYTVCSLSECDTDWYDSYQDIDSIADVLGWSVETLRERTAAWCSEKYYACDATDVDFRTVRDFINAHAPLLTKMYNADAACYDEMFPDYVDRATETLDNLLSMAERGC